MTLTNMTENPVTHEVVGHYLHVCLGHSRDQFEDRNSSQRTHHTDMKMYQELEIIKHNFTKTTEEHLEVISSFKMQIQSKNTVLPGQNKSVWRILHHQVTSGTVKKSWVCCLQI